MTKDVGTLIARLDEFPCSDYCECADARDVVRANRFKEHFFEVTVVCPLIERDINKAACLAILMKAGIQPARTYAEGFPNANCMPCSKATSPDYWSLVRKARPEQFARAVEMSRRLGVKLTRINNVRIFIDEIPADWPTTNPIAPACDFMCHLTTEELSA